MVSINIRNLSFGYNGNLIFDNLNVCLDCGEPGEETLKLYGTAENFARPLVILGPSGCGKTTLLKLLGGLVKPLSGEIHFMEKGYSALRPEPRQTFDPQAREAAGARAAAFVFQEPRLLPWLSVEDNVGLPLEKITGRGKARERARYFLSLVSLEGKEKAMPSELSGGEAQRVSVARAFAWPSPALFMDEPFQSLDIPLRKNLMDLTLSLLAKENRFLIAVTHDPREAVYMGGRIIVLGRAGEGIVFDRGVALSVEDRAYGSAAARKLEKKLIEVLETLV